MGTEVVARSGSVTVTPAARAGGGKPRTATIPMARMPRLIQPILCAIWKWLNTLMLCFQIGLNFSITYSSHHVKQLIEFSAIDSLAYVRKGGISARKPTRDTLLEAFQQKPKKRPHAN
jgi:hypothetical protein